MSLSLCLSPCLSLRPSAHLCVCPKESMTKKKSHAVLYQFLGTNPTLELLNLYHKLLVSKYKLVVFVVL